MAVSADDPRPPYLQVAQDLRGQIDAGTLKPGARLPSGRELSEHYGVALMTVQKALAMLRDEHVIVTFQGRGAFVASGPPEVTPSPEYIEITRQLDEIRELVQQTAEHLDTRLAQLEQSAGLTNDAPKRLPRRG